MMYRTVHPLPLLFLIQIKFFPSLFAVPELDMHQYRGVQLPGYGLGGWGPGGGQVHDPPPPRGHGPVRIRLSRRLPGMYSMYTIARDILPDNPNYCISGQMPNMASRKSGRLWLNMQFGHFKLKPSCYWKILMSSCESPESTKEGLAS